MKPPFKNFDHYRPFQEDVITQAQASTKKVTFIDAPPGSGKSIIGMTLAYNESRSLYLCTTKPLQFQLLHDFPEPEAYLLMGRSNYPCVQSKWLEKQFPDVTCDDCHAIDSQDEPGLKFGCKSRCLYERKKKTCLQAHISILNTAYYLTECSCIGRFSGANLVVVDECDRLEQAIMSFIEINVSERTLARLDLTPPAYKTKWESWKDWTYPLISALQKEIDRLEPSLDNLDSKTRKYYKHCKSLYNKAQVFQTVLDDSWIYQESKGSYPSHSFRPTWVSELAQEYFWRHADRFILMSGTILSASSMARTLGLTAQDYDYIEVPNQFPVASRPVYYLPIANMTAKTKEKESPKLIPAIKSIMEKYSNSKGLIHTVSYNLATYIQDEIWSPRFVGHLNGSDRYAALEHFKASSDPLVLISPSMDRGIDLPYDACRWIILVKVPYPDLGDKQISKRLYSSSWGQLWYKWTTVCSIVQMSMRGVRSIDDACDTWILDAQFGDHYHRTREIFPEWYREAIQLVEEIT